MNTTTIVSVPGFFSKVVRDGRTIARADVLESGKVRIHVTGSDSWNEVEPEIATKWLALQALVA